VGMLLHGGTLARVLGNAITAFCHTLKFKSMFIAFMPLCIYFVLVYCFRFIF
jgi:hypothetical protein